MFDLKTRILIVDDMITMRKLIGKVCRDLGFSDITEAVDGAQAWEKLNNPHHIFDLVISDWNMPNVSGLDLLKKIRGDGKFAKIPFLMVTAEAESSQVGTAVKSGVDQYIVKPFSKETLRSKLEFMYKKYATAA